MGFGVRTTARDKRDAPESGQCLGVKVWRFPPGIRRLRGVLIADANPEIGHCSPALYAGTLAERREIVVVHPAPPWFALRDGREYT